MEKKSLANVGFVVLIFLLLVNFSYANDKKKKDDDEVKNFVSLNQRIEPGQGSNIFSIPPKRVLVLTDIVIQNRSPGDAPVAPTESSRLVLGPGFDDPSNITDLDFFLTVVGNDTLNIHFQTGRVVEERFRIFNSNASSAPFIEFIINGFLTHK
jgi:hypothetical protein